MSARWYLRAALATCVGLAVMAGLARAEGPPVVVMDETAPPAAAPAPRRLFRDWLRRPVGCWSHHDALLCSSWESERCFIFGSCREFFGEPCLKSPRPFSLFHRGQATCPNCP
jgi:hypothetical protein